MDHYPSWKLHKNPFWRVKHRQQGVKQQQQQQQQVMASDPSSSIMVQHNSQFAPNPGMMQNSPVFQQQQQPHPQQYQQQPTSMMQQQQPGMMQQQQPGMMPYSQGMMQQPGMQQQQQQQPLQGMSSPMTMIMMDDGTQSAVVAFEATRDVGGIVRLLVPPGKKMEHLGIKVQFIGRIDMVCRIDTSS
jgi:Vacuolar protein sorting-associated protein 26